MGVQKVMRAVLTGVWRRLNKCEGLKVREEREEMSRVERGFMSKVISGWRMIRRGETDRREWVVRGIRQAG
jgi:hypothetical protein